MTSVSAGTMVAAGASPKISAHGGHSGSFCLHAADSLEALVQAYCEQGFSRVGLTEHMPPPAPNYRYADEVAAGLTVTQMETRFCAYVAEARRLQRQYAGRLQLDVAMESEWYPGAVEQVRRLCRDHRLDYLVGSVHHVGGVNFDFSPQDYDQAVRHCGGIEALYRAYFDAQYDLIVTLEPQLVGHFDLIRLFDSDYRQHLALPAVAERIERNLAAIRQRGLTLDLNMRALLKGATEPYPALPLLQRAVALGIPLVPGDDAHRVADVGQGIDQAYRLLAELGALPVCWSPTRISPKDVPC